MKTFKVKLDDKEIDLAIIKSNTKISLEADKIYTKTFTDSIEAGLLLQSQINNILEERGLTNNKSIKVKTQRIRSELRSLEVQLKSARKEGRKMTKAEGREIAVKMKELRNELNNLGGDLVQYYNNTVESVAQNERLNFYVYALTVDAETGKNFWSSFEDYKNDTRSEIKSQAADAYIKALGYDTDGDKSLPENAWLIRHKFMNDQLQFIDEQGRLITSDGKLINEQGRFINESGALIDEFGNEVTDEGELKVPDGWDEAPSPVINSVDTD